MIRLVAIAIAIIAIAPSPTWTFSTPGCAPRARIGQQKGFSLRAPQVLVHMTSQAPRDTDGNTTSSSSSSSSTTVLTPTSPEDPTTTTTTDDADAQQPKTSAAPLEADVYLCTLPDDYEDMAITLERLQKQEEKDRLVDRFVNSIPFILPIFAYMSFGDLAQLSDQLMELLSSRNFVEVDGGSYRAQIIAPAINGIIIPSCVVTFATLLSITISFLRQRQQEIRTTINTEASELRALQSLVDAFPTGTEKDQCRTYLIQYTSRLIAESQPDTRYNALEATSGESEMIGFLNQLITATDIREDIRAESYSAVARLNQERSARISSLQSSFPPLHYGILTVLCVSICFCYLLETDQDVLVFLYALQLKFLWSILVGVFTGFGIVVYDLIDPFKGTYQISSTVKQLYTIRSALVVSLAGCDEMPSNSKL